MNDSLAQHISHNLQSLQDEVLQSFVEEIKKKYNNTVVGIVFYGSCMRSRDYQDAILDFYVVVDSYSRAYSGLWLRIANYVLAPNVFYLQTSVNGDVYRAKYAIVSEKGLLAGLTKAFHSYFWARFTQPMACIYERESRFKQWFTEIQCAAVNSFFHNVLPSIKKNPSDEEFWTKGLQLTYAAELRAESKSRATTIYENDREYYDKIFSCLINHHDIHPRDKLVNDIKWKVRILYGKFLSVLRLMKATTTFVGGVDYIAWKIERHTGEPVHISDKARKYPWVYIWPVVVNLFKQGKIR